MQQQSHGGVGPSSNEKSELEELRLMCKSQEDGEAEPKKNAVENTPLEQNTGVKKVYPPSPYSKRLQKQKFDMQFAKILDIFKKLHINIPYEEALKQISSFAKFMKGILSRKLKIEELETIALTEECNALLQQKLPSKLKDPGSFVIPCTIGNLSFNKYLCDLGVSINLMPLSIFKKLGLPDPKPVNISLQLADNSITYPRGVVGDVLVKGELTMRVQGQDVAFNVFIAMKFPTDEEEGFKVELINSVVTSKLDQMLRTNALESALKGNDSEDEEGSEQLQYLNASPWKRRLDFPFESLGLSELKNSQERSDEDKLLIILREFKSAIGWTITDVKEISPSYCTHKILLEEGSKPTVEQQRRLNPIMEECVPKKGGITVVANEKKELIPTQTVTRWRVCMEYRKQNKATRKDHFPLPFIDQMFDRLAGHEYYFLLDGYSGYHICIVPEDQEKTTFTCPFGTFTFCRVSFELYGAPATFQRCMTAIFSNMIGTNVEVFMDDFSVFGTSYEECLHNLGLYILLAMDYVSKWVEVKTLLTNDAKVVINFLHKQIFTCFAYHPQIHEQAEVSNQEIKRILEKVVSLSKKDWSLKLDEAVWAYRLTYKTPLGMSLFRLVYRKACHLLAELEHGAYWALKKLNQDKAAAGEKRMFELNELDEFHLRAYKNNKVYKEKVKRWHDKRLVRKSFALGQQVLLFNAHLRLFPEKLKSRWSGPFIVKAVFLHGAMEIFDKHLDQALKVNGQRLKHYYDDMANREVVSVVLSTT
ncbi:uncharacterized protein LOC141696791 [Apium graveolens]|uniref:uncharacterized protein LOC141696791 n=1 Tax=Apium graveolens TaxID=4045 RepID=UPI003D78F7CA